MLLLPLRRKISQIRMVRGPDKILLTLDDVTFIHPSLSNKVSNGFGTDYESATTCNKWPVI